MSVFRDTVGRMLNTGDSHERVLMYVVDQVEQVVGSLEDVECLECRQKVALPLFRDLNQRQDYPYYVGTCGHRAFASPGVVFMLRLLSDLVGPGGANIPKADAIEAKMAEWMERAEAKLQEWERRADAVVRTLERTQE